MVTKETERERFRRFRAGHPGYYAPIKRKARLTRPLDCNQQIAKWNKANPEKVKAHQAVYHAIKKGLLTRQPCIQCGALKTHGHHEDYSKPLEVIWLCLLHHKERHREK